MKKPISYCGLDCESCDAFVATREKDNQLKAQVALRWSRLYHIEIQPEAVFCEGCTSDGTQAIFCQSMCRIKPCCREKGFDSCAVCDGFPCSNLREIFKFSKEAEIRLRRYRKSWSRLN